MSFAPRNSGNRTICFSILTLAGVMATSGCMVPVRSPGKKPDQRSTHQPDRKPEVSQSSTPTGGPVDRLTVNGDTVTADELWADMAINGADGGLSAADPSSIQRRAAQLISEKIVEMLVYAHASKRLPPEVQDKVDQYADREIRKIVTTQHDGVMRRYEMELEKRGLTLDDAKKKVSREIVILSYMEQEVKPKIEQPTRADLLAAYEQIAETLRQPPRRRMSLVDVRVSSHLPKNVSKPSKAELDQARRMSRSLIQTAKAELDSQEAFAEVARRHSDGLHAAEGGSWGWVDRASVRERFVPAVNALYELDAGRTSDVIETPNGFFLVKCDEVDPGVEPSFQAVQPQLKDRYFRGAYNRAIGELAERLRKDALIEPADIGRFHQAVILAAPVGTPSNVSP